MIIVNGEIRPIIATDGGGFDAGRPVPLEETLGTAIPCNIKVNTSDLHGHATDGVFRRTDLTVLIDSDAMSVFSALRVVVNDSRHRRLGVFLVQDVQYLDSVGAIQIALSHAD